MNHLSESVLGRKLLLYHHVSTQHNKIERFGMKYLYWQAGYLDLDLIQADYITLDDDTDEGFVNLSVTALVSMSEHIGTFGAEALSPDNKGDDGEKNLGAPEHKDDNNDNKEPGQLCMYTMCVVCYKVVP